MSMLVRFRGFYSLLQMAYYLFFGYYFLSNRERKKSKRLLLITSNFLPEINGGVYRPLAVLRYSHLFSEDVYALCEQSSVEITEQSSHLLSFIPASVKIFRAKAHPIFFPYRAGRLFAHSFLQMIAIYENAKRIIENNNVGIVMCTGPKFYTFIVGCVLKLKYNVGLILDYRDEWSENPFDFVEKSFLDREMEERALNCADAVVFTTESQAIHCINTFNVSLSDKVKVIYNAVDVTVGKRFNTAVNTGDVCKICYTGLLADFSSFASFVKDFKGVLEKRVDLRSKIVIEIYGRVSGTCMKDIQEFPFKDNLCHLGSKTSQEISEVVMKANSTILFLNEGFRRYLPGKLFDYISAGKPIVVYGLRGDSEISRLTPTCIPLMSAEIGDVCSLEKCFDEVISNKTSWSHSLDDELNLFADKYSRERMAKEFYKLIDAL